MDHPSSMQQTPEGQMQEALDMREFGAPKNGGPQISEKRLYMQLHAYTHCFRPADLVSPIEASGLEAVIYLDVNDPRGVGFLFMAEDPASFTESFRTLSNSEPFIRLEPKREWTMTGRTYSTGREVDLADWLLYKPRRNVFNPAMPWAVWYPLRRKSEFELLPKEEQGKILLEHAKIGMRYGQAGLAHDIRLACHGLDQNDNEFVLGIVASELYTLSRLVQDMRKTQQTARYMQSLGPFFVGKVFRTFPQA